MKTVDNQLQLLISLYEEEKTRLQKLIYDCLAETEYLNAHYYSKALNRLNGRLQILKSMEDKLHDEKDFAQRRISRLERQIESSSEYMKEYYFEILQRERTELEKLNQIPKPATTPDNINLLDDMLEKLMSKKIKHLKLILKKKDNLFLAFSYSKKVLRVTLPYVNRHMKTLYFMILK